MLERLTGLITFLLPGAHQSLGLLCLLATALGMAVIGAALAGRDRMPEADLPVGWSVVSLVFVVLGAWARLSLTLVAALCGVLALAGAVVLWRRRQPLLDMGMARVLVWMAPFLLASASMEPSQWDEFTHWLPNARYLVLFDAFPGLAGLPPSDSGWPAYPPALTIPYLLAARLGGGYFEGVAPWFNLLLLASAARLALRLFRGGPGSGWTGAAWAVLAMTSLSATFVPKLVLSGYADNATAVATAMAAVLGLRLTSSGREGSGWSGLVQFAFVFALLPMTKQGNFALMGLVLAALAGDALLRREALRPWGGRLVAAMVPAALAVLGWRLHVAAGVGEMGVRPPADWDWPSFRPMLVSMKNVALSKGGYFGIGLLLAGLALAGRGRRRLPTLFALCFVGYNLFLVFVYLAVLAGYESANAASFWRYNTHLGVLEMMAVAAVLGEAVRCRKVAPPVFGALAALGFAGAVLVPFIAHHWVRFDDNLAKRDALATIRAMAAMDPPPTNLLVVDVRGSGFYAHFAEYHLGFGTQVVGNLNVFNADMVSLTLERTHPDYLWVRTRDAATEAALGLALDPGASHLLASNGAGGWRPVRSWPFPPGLDPAAEKD